VEKRVTNAGNAPLGRKRREDEQRKKRWHAVMLPVNLQQKVAFDTVMTWQNI